MQGDGSPRDRPAGLKRPADPPKLRRPEDATLDLEPDALETEHVKGGLKSPVTYD